MLEEGLDADVAQFAPSAAQLSAALKSLHGKAEPEFLFRIEEEDELEDGQAAIFTYCLSHLLSVPASFFSW